jgi:TctA family transporter
MVEIEIWHLVVWYLSGLFGFIFFDAKLNKEISLATVLIGLVAGIFGPVTPLIIVLGWLVLNASKIILWKKIP